MSIIDPTDHLRLQAQDRDHHLLHRQRERVADAQSELRHRERRLDQAWRQLTDALSGVVDARRALTADDPT
ncbi:hypothetical protein [Williamsia sterculiae]|uniref:Uncharacterized protein n=1 Tax=Williamsia sterculiae TaxID=1344003 RepID=A0A1N7GZ20_9NOCA|nr:hypothetical protein [Williamsia sterculiae]SIS17776.1 hypothetical protein SAMN05445060_3305 [Williamsia sterculiae]